MTSNDPLRLFPADHPLRNPLHVNPGQELPDTLPDALRLPQVRELPPLPDPDLPELDPGLRALMGDQEAQQRQTDRAIVNAMEQALQVDPDLAAEAQRIGLDLGVDGQLTEANMDKARSLWRRQQIMALRASGGSEITLRMMLDPDFARIAVDDSDQLGFIENLWRQRSAAKLEEQRSLLWERIRTGQGGLREEMEIEAINKQLQDLPASGEVGGWLENLFYSSARIIGGMENTIGQAATNAFAVGSTAIVLGAAVPLPDEAISVPAVMGAAFTTTLITESARREAGAAFGAMRGMGIPDDLAATYAGGVGLINGMLEGLSAGVVTAPVRRVFKEQIARRVAQKMLTQPTRTAAAKKFAKDYVLGVGGEVGTEVLQEISNVIGESMAASATLSRDPNAAIAEQEPMLERLSDIAAETMRGMALLGLPGPVLGLRSDMARAKKAKSDAAFLENLADAVKDSKTAKRSSRLFGQWLEQLAGGTDASTVYVPTETFLQQMEAAGLTRQQLDDIAPEVSGLLREAMGTGTVEIPTSGFGARFLTSDFGRSLIPHSRFDPDGMSAQEAANLTPEEGKRLVEEAEASLEAEGKLDDQMKAEAAQIEAEIAQQIQAAGRSREQAAIGARYYRAFITTQAKELGKTPKQFQEEMGLEFAAMEQATEGAEGLEQTRFYSALGRELSGLKTKSATADGWKQSIKGLVNKGKVKADEIQWTGLEEWLDLQEGKVSKEQVEQFLSGNAVRVEALQLDDPSKIVAGSRVESGSGEDYDIGTVESVEDNGTADVAWDSGVQTPVAIGELTNITTDVVGAQYPEYTLPGGENYREVLLTLPQQMRTRTVWQVVAPPSPHGDGRPMAIYSSPDRDLAQAKLEHVRKMDASTDYELRELNLEESVGDTFKSPHFDEPNIVAHLRLNDRTDSTGSRVLFVEEVQSDWAQAGRREGFNTPVSVSLRGELRELRSQLADQLIADGQVVQADIDPGWGEFQGWKVTKKDGSPISDTLAAGTAKQAAWGWSGSVMESVLRGEEVGNIIENTGNDALWTRAIEIAAALESRAGSSTIPSAPFVETTKGWLNLALKQLLVMASEGGYDKIAFIDGDKSARRYDLSTAVEKIGAERDGEKLLVDITPWGNAEDIYLEVDRDGVANENSDPDFAGKPLDEILGKEMADRLMSITSDRLELEGEGLRVGGKGMIDFYDKLVPNAAKALTKKLGGKPTMAKVEGVGEAFAVEVDEKLRTSVADGVALFARGDQGPLGKFVPSMRKAFLDPDANPSTVFHEMGHYFIGALMELRRRGKATDRQAGDIDTVLQWYGIKGATAEERFAAWESMDFDAREPFEEQFTYSFEKYLFDGQAPTAGLGKVFAKIRAWMMAVYEDVVGTINATYRQAFGRDLPGLTPEVRSVFDRLVASDKAVAFAEQVRSMRGTFATVEEWTSAGHRAEDWAAYQKALQDASEAAVTDLSAASMRQLKWLRNARSRVLREKQKEVEKLRKATEAKVRQEVEQETVYVAMDVFREADRQSKLNLEEAKTVLRRVHGLPEPKKPTPREPRAPKPEDVRTDAQKRLDRAAQQRQNWQQRQQVKDGDDLLTAIAKLGGISREWAAKNLGQYEPKSKSNQAGIFWVFRRKGGISGEQMLQRLQDAGFDLGADYRGDETAGASRERSIADLIDDALSGDVMRSGLFDWAQEASDQFQELVAAESAQEQDAFFEIFGDAVDDGLDPFGAEIARLSAEIDGQVPGRSEDLLEDATRRELTDEETIRILTEELAVIADRNRAAADAEAARQAEFDRAVRRLGWGKRGVLAKDGIGLDEAADALGFDSGESMLREFDAAPPLDDRVQQETTRRLLEDHGDFANPAQIERAVDEALHNEARARFIATELRFLEGLNRPVRVIQAMARVAAEQLIGNRKLRDIQPRRFAQLEARHARDAVRAQKAGEPAEVITAKRRELLAHESVKVASDARDEVGKALGRFRTVLGRSNTRLAQTGNVDLLHGARFLLAQYGMLTLPQAKKSAEYLKLIERYDPDMFARMKPVFDKASQKAKDLPRTKSGRPAYLDMTLDEFRVVRETAEEMIHRAKTDGETTAAGKREKVDAVVAKLLPTLEVPGVIPGEMGAVTQAEKAAKGLLGIKAQLVKIEHMLRSMDGGQTGPWLTYVFDGVRQSLDRYRTDANTYVKRLVDMVQEMRDAGLMDEKNIKAKELNGYVFGTGPQSNASSELLGALMHVRSNRSNREKFLVAGRGSAFSWADFNADGSFNFDRWNAFEQRMRDEGILRPEHYDFIQRIMDMMEEVKPLLQKAHRELKGFPFKEVEAEAYTVEFPDGTSRTYRGGYIPAAADRDLLPSESMARTVEELKEDFFAGLPKVPDGFTKERVEHYRKRPLSMNLNRIAAHFDEAIRYAHVQPRAAEVLRVIDHADLRAAMDRVNPELRRGIIVPFLERAVRQSVYSRGKSEALDQFWRAMRRRTGVAIMFANPVNSLQQMTGLINSLQYVKARHLRHGMSTWLQSRRGEMANSIAERSEFMADRLQNQMLGLTQDLRELLLDANTRAQVEAWISRRAYFFQSTTQNVVDQVTWSGAYEQAIEQNKTEAEAITEADRAVRLSQGSFNPEDVAQYEVNTPWNRTWFQFSNYFNTVLNGIWFSTGSKTKAWLLLSAFPMMVAQAIAMTLWGQWDDEDDDGHLDTLLDLTLLPQISGVAGFVPVAGPALVNAVQEVFSDRPFGDRVVASPAMVALTRSITGTLRAAAAAADPDTDVSGRNVRDVMTAIALFAPGGGLVAPLARPASYLTDVGSGAVEPENVVDAILGVLTGRASEASRQ